MLLLQTEFLAGDLLSSSWDLKIKNILKLEKSLISSLNTLQIRDTRQEGPENFSTFIVSSLRLCLCWLVGGGRVGVLLKVLIIIPKEQSIINLSRHTLSSISPL